MKKVILLTTVVAIATLGVLTLLTLSTGEAQAVGCFRCVLGGTAGPAWGIGSNCTAAINNAISEAESQIPGSCDVCDVTPIEITPCHLCGTYPDDPGGCINDGNYRTDYSVQYKCSVYICQ